MVYWADDRTTPGVIERSQWIQRRLLDGSASERAGGHGPDAASRAEAREGRPFRPGATGDT